ncbi:hypothetical protein EV363DRAFT_1163732 [Boletus edulis]|nr:hypothetical protein EV363DRAFT_1163732 [Boletus edulis]
MTCINAVLIVDFDTQLQSLCQLTYPAGLQTSTRHLSLPRMCRTEGLAGGHPHKPTRLNNFSITRFECSGELSDGMF